MAKMQLKEKRTELNGFSDELCEVMKRFSELKSEERMLALSLMVADETHDKESDILVSEVRDEEVGEEKKALILMMKGGKKIEALIDLMQVSDDWYKDIKVLIASKRAKDEVKYKQVPSEVFNISENFVKLSPEHKDKIIVSLVRARLMEKKTSLWISEECESDFKMILSCDADLVDTVKRFFQDIEGAEFTQE